MSISLAMSTSVTLLRRTPKPHQKRGARKTEIVVRASKANTSSESAAQSNRRQIFTAGFAAAFVVRARVVGVPALSARVKEQMFSSPGSLTHSTPLHLTSRYNKRVIANTTRPRISKHSHRSIRSRRISEAIWRGYNLVFVRWLRRE